MSNTSQKKTFKQCVQNAQYFINKLDRSIQKTSKYETRLLQCKANHAHSHSADEGCNRDQLEVKQSMSNKKEEPSTSSRSPIDLAASWSTMSMVCLQYQYEELSKRYESLLQAHDERFKALDDRDASLQRLRERVNTLQEQLTNTNKALLSVGEKYLKLRYRKLKQKCWYEDRVEKLIENLRKMSFEAEHARFELDEQLDRSLTCDHDTAIALLLAEIQKCNLLFLENIRLKVEMEELLSNIKCPYFF